MLLKRLTAIVVALMLLVQLTACKQNSPSDTSSNISVSNEGIYSDNTITSNNQDDGDTQSGNETDNNISNNQSSDNTSQDNNSSKPQPDSTVSNNQSSDNSRPDNDNENNNNDVSDNATPITPVVSCEHGDEDPYKNVTKSEFYANYTPACCNQDATWRSKHYLLSGSLEVPGQYAQEAANRPKSGNKFVRNTATMYIDNGNTYIVMDATGREAMRIHKSGGYITLEEVAAYMYAFGGSGKIPANYSSKKSTKPSSSPWGEYLRVNHSYFKGDTDRYPYEPELPDISGCGGSLSYYEMDIGTTGTTTPGYAPKPYIQGSKITRGAARIVYARQDLNGNGVYENNEVYVFYTHNHYNDFREYLNYYGGWGEMFGNVTGGGEYSSEYNANPTPYVKTAYADFTKK
ncbi:MAG: hypothetical protein IJE02_02625 [Clostridia bacterium]|nr:hypothetical protein [Clostridia bacterium]